MGRWVGAGGEPDNRASGTTERAGKAPHRWPSGPRQRCEVAGRACGPGAVLCNATAYESLATGRRTWENAKELANSGACVLVRGFVLRDDVRRNATALIDLVSALLRPRADLRTALAAGTSARPAAPGRSTCFARVLHIVG